MVRLIKMTSLVCFVFQFFIAGAAAEPHQGFRYQTVIKGPENAILSNRALAVKVNIFQGNKSTAPIYSEVHNTRTNQFGLVDLQVGQGRVISGDFSMIDWGEKVGYVQIEVARNGMSNYKLIKKERLPTYYQQINEGIILGETQHSGKSPPHTLSVVRPNPAGKFNGHIYWGYVGEARSGNIDLRFSEGLLTWQPYKDNPIIARKGIRWPSVLHEGDAFYMAHTIDFGGDSFLVLKKSTDGIHFSLVSNLTNPVSGEDTRNPYLFKDLNSNNFYLFYKRWTEERSEIRVKEAKTLEGLCKASSKVLLTRVSGTIAAPSMFYANGIYWLLTEGRGKPWVVEAYASATPNGPFIENPSGWILFNDDACPFPYVEGNTLYNFICHRENGTIWKLGLVKSPLSSAEDH